MSNSVINKIFVKIFVRYLQFQM